MKSTFTIRWQLFLILIFTSNMQGWSQDTKTAPLKTEKNYRSDCIVPVAKIDFEINNVRTHLAQGGGLWHLKNQTSAYIVPKNLGVGAIFSSSILVAAYDPFENLKMVTELFQSGNNSQYTAGPLYTDGAPNEQICEQWNRFFTVNSEEILLHKSRINQKLNDGIPYPDSDIPLNIRGWPGFGNPYFESVHGFALPVNTFALGSFHDFDQDGAYDPSRGDYPVVSSKMSGEIKEIIPTMQSFKIFNDAGYASSNHNPLLMQFNATTFAFRTNDEINDMTFTLHKFTNGGSDYLDRGRFAYWIDPDLGCYQDDYLGFDTTRNMAYIYNEDAIDGISGCDCAGTKTYCENIPILGIRFFDTPDKKGVSSFTYYYNGSIGGALPATRNPTRGIEYYRYMTGYWRDGETMTTGGSGYNPGSQKVTKYAFHSPPNERKSDSWSMCSEQTIFGDHRMVISTSFDRLNPGESLEALSGNVFVPSQKYPCPEIEYLQHVSDKAELFLLNELLQNELELKGPDAPDVTSIERDREVIFLLSNTPESNNYLLNYRETDPLFRNHGSTEQYDFLFEGYLVYQLKNAQSSLYDLNNPDNARLVFHSDIKNNIRSIYQWNKVEDPFHLYNFWAPELIFQGDNNGVRSSFKITEDAFAAGGDTRLINHKSYYYVSVAFAHNNYKSFNASTGLGQQFPYLEGKGNRNLITAIPRPVHSEIDSIPYGTSLPITRLDGKGNPGVFLKLKDGMYEHILSQDFDGQIKYENGFGPVLAKIVDASKLQNAKLQLTFFNENLSSEVTPSTQWKLTNIETGETIISEQDLSRFHEQVFETYGISIEMFQPDTVGINKSGTVIHPTNGMINTRILHSAEPWLSGIASSDLGSISPGNSPDFSPMKYVKTDPGEADFVLDPNQALTNTMAPFFVPFSIADHRFIANAPDFLISPMIIEKDFAAILRSRSKLENTNNVDIVLTSDKSKWSRSVVIETSNPFYKSYELPTVYNRKMFDSSSQPSIGKDGRYATIDGTKNGTPLGNPSTNPDDPNYLSPLGMGWFPGYAIDVETGERLNIFFGENTSFTENFKHLYKDETVITDDLIWNPSDQLFLQPGIEDTPISYFMGGQHFIYVTKQAYDGCAMIYDRLKLSRGSLTKGPAFSEITWSGFPILMPGQNLLSYEDGLIPSQTIIQLRVNQPYSRFKNGVNEGLPQYLIEIDTDILSGFKYEPNILTGVSIFPNPISSSESKTLYLRNIPGKCEIRLMDLYGRTLIHQKIEGHSKERLDQLRLSLNGLCLQAGIYFVEIQAYEEGRSVHKILCF